MRLVLSDVLIFNRYFNPRTHRGVRLISKIYFPLWDGFQSTHPSWGATLLHSLSLLPIVISIHAPIVGCDIPCLFFVRQRHFHFNPRTHRGVRRVFLLNPIDHLQFQSTHPSWGATWAVKLFTLLTHKFQSTHPSWGATTRNRFIYLRRSISIHAPIVGCDCYGSVHFRYVRYFNPRTHRGVRLRRNSQTDKSTRFQSTHPSWGATYHVRLNSHLTLISIHAPIVGCDISNQ